MNASAPTSTPTIEEIRKWRAAFRGHYFKCVPENAQVFERTVEDMLGHVDFLLAEYDRLKAENRRLRVASYRDIDE